MVHYDRTNDPVFLDVPTAHRLALPVLGFDVEFTSNSSDVIEAVEESFGRWLALRDRADLITRRDVRLRIVVHPGTEGSTDHAPIAYRQPDAGRLLITTPGSVALADRERLDAAAFVTPDLVADRRHFQYGVVEALTLFLLTGLDRHPVHAATVRRNGTAAVLVGASGTGKSTLAYAAARQGFDVLGEDVAYVQLAPAFRVWALPGRVHLPAEGARHFDDIGGAPTLLANGKRKVAVDAQRSAELPVADRAVVCLLARNGAAARLEPVSPDTVAAALTDGVEDGFSGYTETAGPAARALAKGGAYRLELSTDPAEAVALLSDLFDRLAAGSSFV